MNILKELIQQKGSIIIINLLKWIEQIQKKLKLEEHDSEEKKINFWIGNVDLQSINPHKLR